MTSVRFLEFLLLLLLHQVYSEEETEPVFRAEGAAIEMGYCFGVDYIVVYRCAPEGDQLLGNSSANNKSVTPPEDLQGRIHTSNHEHLLGLQISGLTHKDSGVYRRECWQNQVLESQHTQQLYVCNEEVESGEITVKEGYGGAELLCNNTSIVSKGTSVRWYQETYQAYKPTLLLDSSVSLDPPVDEGVMEVRDNGALLLLNNSMLKNNHHFICLVSKGKNCLSFQNMRLPDRTVNWDIFASQGDTVVLKCPTDGSNQQWETPLGRINGSSVKMNISLRNKSEDFSLVIPAFSDELSGDYLCISFLLEVQYFLGLCPKKESQEKVFVEGGSVLLECHVGKDDSQRVLWHRQTPSGEGELILDSVDKTVPVPEDLRGRLTLSENGSLLTIAHLEVNNRGVYWCIVLGSDEFLEAGDDYEDDYDEEGTGEDDFLDDLFYEDTPRCIFKQETILSLNNQRGRGFTLKPVISKPGTRNDETGPTADPPEAPNVTAYAVGAGLVGLLVVGAVVAAIVIKRRAKAKHRGAASRSEMNMTKDPKMNVDPESTKSLTHNDEHDA